MWSNFFVPQEEEGRMGVAGGGQGGGMAGMKGFRGQRRTNKMSDSQEGKIKLVFFVAIIGVTLTVLGMGTEFWVELAQPKNYSGNQTCQMAHYGLWKGCIRTLWVADIDPERTSCGPAELPGESNCTYFKFFTSGENAVIFKKTTSRSVLVLLSVLIFHQSVLALLSSDHSVPLHHELSWSVACVGSAGAILIIAGVLFIILALPFSPWQKCFPHKDSTT
ncbi:voltage-dependent calcium channel gamma-6 subunit isoform X2 [Girardinichthys multiradiatus]|uniref:voltage-dependent calcium channel gamma-6 subunit isoform X2 n=1 Tax=Girardinichthys multiradiatus TaxID=208333 RepID=UPI001FAB7F7C|nr:voltage-dependent calcium channel gamma-6 subunit isoform X2 [Girardinichthys multiradiatus]